MGESVVAAKQESTGNNMAVAVKQEPTKADSDVVTVIVDEGYSSPAQYPMPSKKKKKEEEEEKIPQKKQQKRNGGKRTRSAEKKQTTSTKKQGGRRRSHSTSPPSYIVEIKQADEHGIFSNGRLATLKYLDFFLPKKSEMCLEDKKKELGEHMDEEVDESIYLEHMQKLANISSVGM